MFGCRIFCAFAEPRRSLNTHARGDISGHTSWTLPSAGTRFALARPPGSGDAWLLGQFAAQARRAAAAGRAICGRCARCAAAGRRDPVLRSVARGASAARLGDAAVRHAVAASGPGVGAPRDAVSTEPAAIRNRRAGRLGHQRAVSAVACAVCRRPYVLLQAGPDDRRRAVARATGVRRLSARVAGRRAGRVCDSRRIDRPVPDGLGAAVPARPVRRPARHDSRIRSGHAARAVSGARSPPAAGPRVSDRRSGAAGVSPSLARAHRRRPEPLERLQGHRHRHCIGRASSTTCRCFSTRPRRCSTTCRPTTVLALHGPIEAAMARFWNETSERYRFLSRDVDAPDPAAGRSVSQRRRVFLAWRRITAASRWAKGTHEGFDALPPLAVERRADDPISRLRAFVDDLRRQAGGRAAAC